jgi:hypothetical protein
VICPRCHPNCNGIEHDACQASTVTIVRTTPGTLDKIHFWDEHGNEHHHNPNVIVTEYVCSHGHRFAERSSWQCSVCGYMACPQEFVTPTEPEPEAPKRRAVSRTPGVPAEILKKREKARKGKR